MGSTPLPIGDVSILGNLSIVNGTWTTMLTTTIKVMSNGACGIVFNFTFELVVGILIRGVKLGLSKGTPGKSISFFIEQNTNMGGQPGKVDL